MSKSKKWQSVSKARINLMMDETQKNSAPMVEGDVVTDEKNNAPMESDCVVAEGAINGTCGDVVAECELGIVECVPTVACEDVDALLAMDGALDVMDDWEVARALHIRRRNLHFARHYDAIDRHSRSIVKSKNLKFLSGDRAKRGIDWDVVDGEVGMTRAWCYLNGIGSKVFRKAGGVISCVIHSRPRSYNHIFCTREDNGALILVRVVSALDFVKGMLIEARMTYSGYIANYKIPHVNY